MPRKPVSGVVLDIQATAARDEQLGRAQKWMRNADTGFVDVAPIVRIENGFAAGAQLRVERRAVTVTLWVDRPRDVVLGLHDGERGVEYVAFELASVEGVAHAITTAGSDALRGDGSLVHTRKHHGADPMGALEQELTIGRIGARVLLTVRDVDITLTGEQAHALAWHLRRAAAVARGLAGDSAELER